jgi:hypothetical protein
MRDQVAHHDKSGPASQDTCIDTVAKPLSKPGTVIPSIIENVESGLLTEITM